MVASDARYEGMNDRQLAMAAMNREDGSFEALYARFHSRVFGFALRRVGRASDAEDIVQETFLQVHRSLPSYQGRASLSTWIFGIAHNVTCRHFRSRGAAPISLLDDEAPELGSALPSEERRIDAARAVERCTSTLARSRAPEHLEIFRLFYGARRSLRAIARSTGKPIETVKDSLRRSRNLLLRDVRELHGVLAAASA